MTLYNCILKSWLLTQTTLMSDVLFHFTEFFWNKHSQAAQASRQASDALYALQ